jgi:sec-independent protein translocase protein TatA
MIPMFGMGAPELLVVLFIVVLLFGATKIPELGRSLGAGLNNFKRGLKEGDEGPTPERPKPDDHPIKVAVAGDNHRKNDDAPKT